MENKVLVASVNPVKINAVKMGMERMFPDRSFIVEGKAVSSGVSDQPMSDEETLLGAQNRAKSIKEKYPHADFWVGIEGGINKHGQDTEAFAWVVVQTHFLIGKAKTATFFLPKAVTALIDSGMEMGEADDIVFGHSNSKQKNGAVGILTGDVMNRTTYYTEAVILALIPFKNQNLYIPK